MSAAITTNQTELIFLIISRFRFCLFPQPGGGCEEGEEVSKRHGADGAVAREGGDRQRSEDDEADHNDGGADKVQKIVEEFHETPFASSVWFSRAQEGQHPKVMALAQQCQSRFGSSFGACSLHQYLMSIPPVSSHSLVLAQLSFLQPSKSQSMLCLSLIAELPSRLFLR